MLPVLPMLAACAEGAAAPDVAEAVELTGDAIRIRLRLVPALAASSGSFVVYGASVIVVRVGAEYRAFSNVCTHAGCGIAQFVAMRLRCQCHGSEFDLDGTNVEGPAPSPLERLAVTLEEDGAVLRVTRPRTVTAPA